MENACARNFTSLENLEDPTGLGTIVTLPPNFNFSVFEHNQWIFPNLRFGCNDSLSRITVRVNVGVGQARPQLFIWEDMIQTSVPLIMYERVSSNSPTSSIVESGSLDTLIYTFQPPLEVTEKQFVGFAFDHNGPNLLSHTIAFMDVGEGNASFSIHTSIKSSGFTFFPDFSSSFVIQTTRYIPVIAAEFGKL